MSSMSLSPDETYQGSLRMNLRVRSSSSLPTRRASAPRMRHPEHNKQPHHNQAGPSGNIPATSSTTYEHTQPNSSSRAKTSDTDQMIRVLTRDLWSDQLLTVESGLDRLTNLCCGKQVAEDRAKKNSKLLRSLGASIVLIGVVEKHPYTATVQKSALRALANLACHSRKSKTRIVALGGIELVLKALRIHTDQERLQHVGIVALYNLADSDLDHALRLQQHGGIHSVIASMQLYCFSETIQRAGCSLIRALCTIDEDFKAPLVEAGAAAVLVQILEQSFPEATTVRARRALQQLLVHAE